MPLSPCRMVPVQDASIQKTVEKLGLAFSNNGQPFVLFCLLLRHFFNKLQANLSLSNTPHSMQ